MNGIGGQPVELPALLAQRLQDFIRAQSRAAPGAVSGAIVTGSVLASDWVAGLSDIDAVFITTRPFTSGELTVLSGLHADTVPGGPIDGIYLTEADLAAGPDEVGVATQVVEGELLPALAGGQLTWITWREIEHALEAETTSRELRWEPTRRRYPSADAEARAFCRRNLHDYWAPLGETVARQLEHRGNDDVVSSRTLQWLALGPARLVATIETGRIISKTAAAAFASERWSGYRPLLARAAAARAGEPETFTVADAHTALRLLDECVAAASVR